MRSRTIRFAAAATGARKTVIPFASRAAIVLFTRRSSALVPHRRVSDPSGPTSTSLIIRNLLSGNRYTCNYNEFKLRIIAYANTFESGRRCTFRSNRGEGGAGQAWLAGMGRAA